jgi:cyclopropane fatty-acyl-phospholipid synthase-like methyltransferase
VCEVGCGAGGILALLAADAPAAQFAGYEISPQAFEICSKKEKDNLHFFLKNLLEDDGVSFELVLALDVLEHVEDYIGFLSKLRGKGTYKMLHIPLDVSVQSVLRSTPIMTTRTSFGHLHYFTKETALASLKDTGYEVLDHFYTGISVDLPRSDWRARLMRLPRKFLFAIHQDWTVRILGGYSMLVLAR